MRLLRAKHKNTVARSLVKSAALSKWMYGLKAEEEGQHLPVLMNSKEYATQSISLFFPSFCLHSPYLKGAVHHYSRTELIKGD